MDWKMFLEEWNGLFAESLSRYRQEFLYGRLEKKYGDLSSLNRPGASEKEIRIFCEKFPYHGVDQFADFYRVSNGLFIPFFDAEPCELLPISSISNFIDCKELSSTESFFEELEDYTDSEYRLSDDPYVRKRDGKKLLQISNFVDCGCVTVNYGFAKKFEWEIFQYTPRGNVGRFDGISSFLQSVRKQFEETMSKLA